MEANIQEVYNSYSPAYRHPLLRLRQLIYEVAASLPQVGEVSESLKWGQPTYRCKTGTPIRLDRFGEDKIALFVHCQTSLIDEFRTLFSDTLSFSKTRAIVLDPTRELPLEELALFVEKALTYHTRKKAK